MSVCEKCRRLRRRTRRNCITFFISVIVVYFCYFQGKSVFTIVLSLGIIQEVNNTTDGTLSGEGMLDTQYERIQTLRSHLYKINATDSYCMENRRIVLDVHRNILYCHVAKIGSTFWMRVLNILVLDLDVQNPFDIPRAYVKRNDMPRYQSSHFDTTNWLKFLFVRNPYERILSTYIDKFVSPNIVYFLGGKYFIQNHRKNAKPESLSCGHDLRFQEFVEGVVSKVFPDDHWCPISSLCDFGRVNYSFIGKMESYSTDTEFLMNVIDSGHRVRTNDDGTNTVNDVISVNLERAFKFKTSKTFQTADCSFIDLNFALQRVWKVLKMKAFIDHDLPYPFDDNMKDETFGVQSTLEIIHTSMRMSFRKYSRESLKSHILYEAYQSISDQTRKAFIKHFYLDFTLFGYSTKISRPTEIFDWHPFS